MKRSYRALPLVALMVALSGCTQLASLVTPAAKAIANADPNLVSSLVKVAAGQLLPPPKNANDNLVPVFLKGLAGQTPGQDEIQKILQLCNGALTGQLPAEPGRNTVTVTTASQVSAFGLLADGPFKIRGVDEQQVVGLGGVSPKKTQGLDLAMAALFDNAPILSAILDGAGRYKVLSASDTVDLRSKMPPIRNQGQRGTCVLFAASGILDYMYSSSALPIKQASPQFLDWLYQMEVKTKVPDEQPFAWQDSGTVPDLFYPLLHIDGNREVSDDAPYIPPQQGYLSEAACPYQANQADASADADLVEISHAQLGDALAGKIAAKQAFASQGAYFFRVKMDAASFESALAGGQPIQLGYPVYGHDWDAPDASQNYEIPEMTESKAADKDNIGFHSVDIVGYERNAGAPGGGWFIVRNSWGTDWGEQGYCRVSYDTTLKYAQSAYVATPYAKTFDAQYDLAPPPKVAPPEDQVLASRPLPSADQQSADGGYTTTDVANSPDLDQLFSQFVTEIQKDLGIKLPF